MKFNADDVTLQVIDDRPHICFRFNVKSLGICDSFVEEVKAFIQKNKEIQIDVIKKKKLRSLDANAYMWTLCDKIAKAISIRHKEYNTGITYTKEDVYKHQIKELGVFAIVPIKNEAVDTYIQRWNKRGLGWIAEVSAESKIKGYKNVITYFGSSSYTTDEFSRLLDGVVQDAKQLGIETATPEELSLMKEEWK